MAVLDAKLNFDVVGTGQAITATAASTDEIDLGVADPNIGVGTPVEAVVTVTSAFASAAEDETLTISVQESSDSDSDSFTTIASSEAIAYASLTKGSVWRVPIPRSTERYLQLYYTVAGSGDFTTGTVSAYLAAQAG